ncbi:protein Mis18-beta [Periophthalmus magnuspinnatus]|uniref:protein Mis18-beta n=1 Tax=Periophthalmus magnuspinnatus TaxID=409849 RepID=UPI0024372812|nr:protein Mis18-beta [Periophthalmus magnuspinnatus]
MEFIDYSMVQRTDHVMFLSKIDRRWMTFHCETCNAVLGDGLSVCGEVKTMSSIVFLKVTKDVIIDEEETEDKEYLADCIYSFLSCRCCRSVVGKIIHSAPSRLSNCRSMFLLHKPSINCYLLNSSSVVKATSISFEVKPLGETIQEIMDKYGGMLKHKAHLKEEPTESTISSC